MPKVSPGSVWMLALAVGCGGGDGTDASRGSRDAARSDSEQPRVLYLAAASDLQAVLPELIAAFEAKTPGVRVKATFGASGQLAEQIKAGAPFDLFLAANMAFVNDLATRNYIERGSIRPYAVGALVLAVRRDSAVAVAGLADVARPDVKAIAIANPEVAPYGAAARQALQRAGLWNDVEKKVVIVESVRQALQVVQTGNAEVGLVGRATVDVPEVSAVEIDPALYDPIVQAMGVVSGSPNQATAAAFAAHLRGEPSQSTLGRYGYKRPPTLPAAP